MKSIDNAVTGFSGAGCPVVVDPPGEELKAVLESLLSRDYAPNTREALFRDVREFVSWYEAACGERFSFSRTVERDVADFRDSLRKL